MEIAKNISKEFKSYVEKAKTKMKVLLKINALNVRSSGSMRGRKKNLNKAE